VIDAGREYIAVLQRGSRSATITICVQSVLLVATAGVGLLGLL
jgi:hypothetical protein